MPDKSKVSASEITFILFSLTVGGQCPSEYYGYRDHCYRYYAYPLRKYRPELYGFQKTWQTALSRCEEEQGSLVSIHSEEEAYWIKVHTNNLKFGSEKSKHSE